MAKPRVLAIALLICASRCFATEAPAPPITPAGLIGVWEAIPGQTQLYRMELFGSTDGYLAFMTTEENRQLAAIFRLTSAKIAGGHVHLEFTNLAKDSFASERASVDGRGFAFDSVGGISAKLTFRGGSNYSFDIFFLKGAITCSLAKASTRAEHLIKAARAQRR